MKTKFDPSLFFALSVLLGYLATLLPWMNLTVQLFADGAVIRGVARFWESTPSYIAYPSCPVPLDIRGWLSEDISRSYRWLNQVGWFAVFIQFSLWVAILFKNRKRRPTVIHIGFIILIVAILDLWLFVMTDGGPILGCPEMRGGVIVHKVAPVFSTLAVALGSVGLGVMGLRSSSVSNGDATR